MTCCPTSREKERASRFIQGTLELLLLRTLIHGPAHGHAIARHIQQASDDLLDAGDVDGLRTRQAIPISRGGVLPSKGSTVRIRTVP